jgi:multiple sugar transport system substrate-binding protein
MRSLVEQKISPPPGGTFDRFTAAAQGKLAMFGGGRWPIINMRALNTVDKMKVAQWPQKTQKGSPVGWDGYGILKDSPNKEAAWAFVKFTTSKQAGEYFVAQGGGTTVPLRKSVANGGAYLSNAPKGIEKLYTALDYATPIPSPDKGNIIQKDIEDAWAQMLAGNVSVEQGLAQLDQKIKANL